MLIFDKIIVGEIHFLKSSFVFLFKVKDGTYETRCYENKYHAKTGEDSDEKSNWKHRNAQHYSRFV